MNHQEFEQIVRDALNEIPGQLRHALENVAIIVEDEPGPEDARGAEQESEDELLGTYHGVPLSERGASYSGLPDRIVIYRGPILRSCETREEIAFEIRNTVIHELGHRLGLSDNEMPY